MMNESRDAKKSLCLELEMRKFKKVRQGEGAEFLSPTAKQRTTKATCW